MNESGAPDRLERANFDMPETKTPKLEQVKKLKSDYDQLIQEVRDDLLHQIERPSRDLKRLDTSTSCKNCPNSKSARAARTGTRRLAFVGAQLRPNPTENFDARKNCRVCGTVGHDGRAHRRQRGGRRPFTYDELAQLGLRTPPVVSQVDGVADQIACVEIQAGESFSGYSAKSIVVGFGPCDTNDLSESHRIA